MTFDLEDLSYIVEHLYDNKDLIVDEDVQPDCWDDLTVTELRDLSATLETRLGLLRDWNSAKVTIQQRLCPHDEVRVQVTRGCCGRKDEAIVTYRCRKCLLRFKDEAQVPEKSRVLWLGRDDRGAMVWSS